MKNSGTLKLLGGRLCLDFVNSVDWRGREHPEEYFKTYQDVVIWSQHVGTITEPDAQALLQRADSAPWEAKKAHRRAIDLRETLYRILATIIHGDAPSTDDMMTFNSALSEVMRLSRIIGAKEGFSWDTDGDRSKLDWLLNPIIRSAADLLVSSELKSVKKCADSACGWLFLDVSRNQSRRWCDMKDCGNRAKAGRFYQKRKSQKRHP